MIDNVFDLESFSIQLVQLFHNGVNFCCLRLPGRSLLKILGPLRFNVAVDVGSFVGLILGSFRWRFGHGDGFSPDLRWLAHKVV